MLATNIQFSPNWVIGRLAPKAQNRVTSAGNCPKGISMHKLTALAALGGILAFAIGTNTIAGSDSPPSNVSAEIRMRTDGDLLARAGITGSAVFRRTLESGDASAVERSS